MVCLRNDATAHDRSLGTGTIHSRADVNERQGRQRSVGALPSVSGSAQWSHGETAQELLDDRGERIMAVVSGAALILTTRKLARLAP